MNYYKRIKNGEVVELHIHEEKDGYVVATIIPEPKNEDEFYLMNEMVELEDIDELLDAGIDSKILNIS